MGIDVSLGSGALNVPLLNVGGIAGFIDTTLLGVEKTTTVKTTTAGTTAGTVNDYQKISIEGSIISDLYDFAGYENDTVSNQTIAFKTPYTTFNGIVANTTGLTITVSLTGITITTPDATTIYNGILLIQGV